MTEYYVYKQCVNEFSSLTVRPVFAFSGKGCVSRRGVRRRGNLKPAEWRTQVNNLLRLYEFLAVKGGLQAPAVPRARLGRLRQLYKRSGTRSMNYGREQEMMEVVSVGVAAVREA